MERVSVARMATAKLQGWIHAARGMGVSGSVTTELNSYVFCFVYSLNEQRNPYPSSPKFLHHSVISMLRAAGLGQPTGPATFGVVEILTVELEIAATLQNQVNLARRSSCCLHGNNTDDFSSDQFLQMRIKRHIFPAVCWSGKNDTSKDQIPSQVFQSNPATFLHPTPAL